MNISFFIDFIKHYLTAKTRHGTHSPFVYKLTDEVIYDFKFVSDYNFVEVTRKKLYSDDRTIEITNWDDESRINRSKNKKVRDIAKTRLKSPRLSQLLYRLAKYHKPSTIIEIGTCLGITTSYLSLACPDVDVITMEDSPQMAEIAAQNFRTSSLNSINLNIGSFDHLLPSIVADQGKVDFLSINGHHGNAATLGYFNWCLPYVHEGSVLILADIYDNNEMKEAWGVIKAHPQVTVTVDLFWIGLIYFKSDQAKEHFKIRF